ncbi:hypothetical protein SAMN05519104_3317 [Rhizobiales bacterium GAS188]|nr:hypothetical protein SAMN05519104_3317 [Rhizobiales bacterium GAS188]
MALRHLDSVWPELPYAALRPTLETLQLWTQVVGKVRLAKTPWVNHSWHVTLYVSARGLTTGLVPHGALGFELEFDFVSQALVIRVSDGGQAQIALMPRSVADFHAELSEKLAALWVPVEIDVHPNEVAVATPFPQDRVVRDYDHDGAHRFWLALVQCNRVLNLFRTRFIGKSSPVHFFWGSFDLAVTRFSGRSAPLHPGGVPHLPDAVTREAYSHEVSSAGFWPGGGDIDYAAFYSYSYPTPAGFAEAVVAPQEARFDPQLGEFLLPYDAVRNASDPDAVLLSFLQSTYEAAAKAGAWDRSLEIDEGLLGRPRLVV